MTAEGIEGDTTVFVEELKKDAVKRKLELPRGERAIGQDPVNSIEFIRPNGGLLFIRKTKFNLGIHLSVE